MNKKIVVLLATGLLGAATSFADEPRGESMMAIAIAGDDGSANGPFVIELSGDDLGFDLADMQVGESRAIVDKAGQNILVTKTEKGVDFTVDGRTVSMPAFDGPPHFTQAGGFSTGDFDVEFVGGDVQFFDEASSGITVLTSTPIDANTQATIRSVLQSAGHTENVTFVDTSVAPEMHGGIATRGHRIKVVKADVRSEQ
jgi:hypothetical protein